MNAPVATRRIRPWIAALLTLLGWGVGLYYARRSRDASRFAYASVIVGILLAAALSAYIFLAIPDPRLIDKSNGWTIADTISLGLGLIVAAIVWRLAAKNTNVERGSPVRLVGYVWIWLWPTLLSLILAFAIRTSAVHPFRAPSASMQPTISVGQHFLITKWSYGYSRFSFAPFEQLLPRGRILSRLPERGDIAVFRPPSEPDRDFVKRIVGLPGDRIQMIGGALFINGEAVTREALGEISIQTEYPSEAIPSFRETLPNGVSYVTLDRNIDGELDNTRIYVVPAEHYFMMGDDRDFSDDSRRSVGYVPFENLVGRVDRLQRLPPRPPN